MVLLLTFAVTWLCVGLGLSAKSVETASNSPMFLIILPFLGSGFVPTSSLPAGIRWFAEYQPFTPVNETLRGLLTGTTIGDNLVITIAWCVGVGGAVVRLVAAAVRARTQAALNRPSGGCPLRVPRPRYAQ